MKRIMTAEDAEAFAEISQDKNCLHSDSEMWRDYKVPALIPGMQTLCTALASIDKGELAKLNYVQANFQGMIPVESEVEFNSERINRGGWKGFLKNFFEENKSAEDIRISAYFNGTDALGTKDEPSFATRVELLEKPSFNEGDLPLIVKTNQAYLEKCGELTGLPSELIFRFYALALSSSSAAYRIKNPGTVPSWIELHNSLVAPADKRKIPVYDSLEAYFHSGFISSDIPGELVLRSAIRKEGNVYFIDTICQQGDERLYGVRASLKQRRQDVIVKGIANLLEGVENGGNPGTLSDAIQRRRTLLGQPEVQVAA